MVRRFTIVFLVSSFSFVQPLVASDSSCAADLSRRDKSTQVDDVFRLSSQSRAEIVGALMAQVEITSRLRRQLEATEAQRRELVRQINTLVPQISMFVERSYDLEGQIEEQRSRNRFLTDLVEQERQEAFEEIANLQRVVDQLGQKIAACRRNVRKNL